MLLTPHDFGMRTQYLHARETLRRLLDLGVVPVVNENDTVADDEIRYGDNDRLAALVSHLVARRPARAAHRHRRASSPPIPGVDAGASLIEEIAEVDAALEALAGGTRHRAGERRDGHQAGRGQDRGVVGRAGGHRRRRRARRRDATPSPGGRSAPPSCPGPSGCRAASCGSPSPAAPAGRVVVDDGARRALCRDNRSLLPAGVRAVEGAFDADDAVEIVDGSRRAVRERAGQVPRGRAAPAWPGRRTSELDDGLPHEVVHRDDLVVLPT